jgi:hypothetical protein
MRPCSRTRGSSPCASEVGGRSCAGGSPSSAPRRGTRPAVRLGSCASTFAAQVPRLARNASVT